MIVLYYNGVKHNKQVRFFNLKSIFMSLSPLAFHQISNKTVIS